MATRIQHRRGTAAAWASANPILTAGEPGYETDTGVEKTGDGSTRWNALPSDDARFDGLDTLTAGYGTRLNALEAHPVRVDNTVGRRAFAWDAANSREQLIYGDTGFRDIRGAMNSTALLDGGKAIIRRTGNTVELSLYDIRPTSGTASIIGSQASGFSPPDRFGALLSVSSLGAVRESIVFSNGQVTVYNAAGGDRIRASLMWTTAQPWPITLPGVAA